MDRFVLVLLALAAVGALASFLLSKLFKRKWIWYFPSLIGVLVIIYYSWQIEFGKTEGFEALGYFLLMLMAIAIVVGNVIANIVITLRRKKQIENK